MQLNFEKCLNLKHEIQCLVTVCAMSLHAGVVKVSWMSQPHPCIHTPTFTLRCSGGQPPPPSATQPTPGSVPGGVNTGKGGQNSRIACHQNQVLLKATAQQPINLDLYACNLCNQDLSRACCKLFTTSNVHSIGANHG